MTKENKAQRMMDALANAEFLPGDKVYTTKMVRDIATCTNLSSYTSSLSSRIVGTVDKITMYPNEVLMATIHGPTLAGVGECVPFSDLVHEKDIKQAVLKQQLQWIQDTQDLNL